MVRTLPLRLLVMALPLASCVQDYGDTPFACTSGQCPSGYRCVEHVCRRTGTTPIHPKPPDGTVGLESPWPHLDKGPAIDHSVGLEPRPADIAKLVDKPVQVGLTCSQIVDCQWNCYNQACADACYNQGSVDGKTKLDVLDACFDQHCYYCQSDQDCYNCEMAYCGPQRAACGI
jgi:hypothetical protein